MENVEKSIIKLLLKEPKKRFRIEDLAKQLTKIKKVKHSRASVYRYANKLLAQNILKSESIGRIKQITLNLKNEQTIAVITELETIKKQEFLKRLKPALAKYFKELYDDAKSIYEIHSILVFGSYAKGIERPDSDIDIMFLIEKPHAIHTEEDIKNFIKKTKDLINAIVNNLEEYLGYIKVSPLIIEFEDYKKCIKEDKIDIVTESFKNHIIIKNPFEYWIGISEAIIDEKTI